MGYKKVVEMNGYEVTATVHRDNGEVIATTTYDAGFIEFVLRQIPVPELVEKRAEKAHKWADEYIKVLEKHETNGAARESLKELARLHNKLAVDKIMSEYSRRG